MTTSKDYPDFSMIRSPVERAEAQRGYELGCRIGEGLYAVHAWVGRLAAAVSRETHRVPHGGKLPPSLPTWE